MTEQVKILFLSASPKDVGQIRLGEEVREVDQNIQLGRCRDQLALIPHFAVRPRDLRETLLRHEPQILHFSGHGSPTKGIVLEDNTGHTQLVSTDALAALLRIIKDNLRIVVLNACYSSLQAEAISQIVDFTIGMNKEIGDRAAIVFSAAFYQGLAFGRSVQESFDLGVSAIMMEGIDEANKPDLLTKKGADAAQSYLVTRVKRRTDKEKRPAKLPQGSQISNVELTDTEVNARGDVNITGMNYKG